MKFYIHCVDGTCQLHRLLLVKCQDIDKVLQAFNGLEKNRKFNVDKFENKTPHFVDLEASLTGLNFF